MGLCSAGGEWVRLGGSGLDMVEPSVSAFFGEPLGFQVGLTQGLAFLSSLSPGSLPFLFWCAVARTTIRTSDRWTGEGAGCLPAGLGTYFVRSGRVFVPSSFPIQTNARTRRVVIGAFLVWEAQKRG